MRKVEILDLDGKIKDSGIIEFRTANKREAMRKMTELLHRGEFRGYSREGNTHVILFARRRCTSQ